MSKPGRGSRLTATIALMTGLIFAPYALADDEDDVLDLIHQYGELEGDLAAQSDLMRDDRDFITGGVRQTDNAKNMEIQMATRAAFEALTGGKTRFITTIESPRVKVFGNVAVASFIRIFNTYPHNQAPNPPGAPNWVTLVLVKEGGEWGIAHTHQSPVGGN